MRGIKFVMRFFISLLIAIWISTMGAHSKTNSSRLIFEPPQPQPGQNITVIYSPEGGPLSGEKEFYLVYEHTAWSTAIDLRKEIRLQPRDGKLMVELDLPVDATYFWCFVRGSEEDIEDTNNGAWWDIYLFKADGTPVEGARLERAAMYQRGKLLAQDRDAKALRLFEEELRFFPKSARAWYSLWGQRYRIANRSIEAKKTITAEIEQFQESRRDEPWAYEAAALGYNYLRSNNKSVSLMREFVKRFPEDTLLDDRIMFFFGGWGKPEDLESLLTHSNRWDNSSRYWRWLFEVYVSHKVEPARFYKAGQRLLALTPEDKDPGGEIRFRVAEQWLIFGIDPKEAERVSRKAVAISELGERPPIVSNTRVKKRMLDRMINININRNVLGWALYHQQRYEEALHELEQAVELLEKEEISSRDVYYRLGKILEKLDRPQEAMEAFLKELAWGTDSKLHRTAVEELYRRLNGNADGLESFIRGRVNDLITQTAQKYIEQVQDVNEDLGRFDLLDSQGQYLNLNQHKGKIVIIEFWATWCSPCLKSMEHTHELQQAFPGQIVVIAVSGDPEERHMRAKEYLSEKGYNFILAFDDEKKRDVKLPYIPARLIMDRQGRLRVLEFGYTKETVYLFEKKLADLLAKKRDLN